MTRCEYTIIVLYDTFDSSSTRNMEEELDRQAQKGWRVAGLWPHRNQDCCRVLLEREISTQD
jgi:hypothetical protein